MEIRVAAFCLPLFRSIPKCAQAAASFNFPAFTPTAGALLSGAPANRATLRFSPPPAF